MNEKIKKWWKYFIKWIGIVFGVIGAISVFFPLADVTASNINIRIFVLVGVVVLIAVWSAAQTIITINKKDKVIYDKGKTRLIFEYKDLRDILNSSKQLEERATIVVPINTKLDIAFDRSEIRENTTHRLILDYIYEQRLSELDRTVLDDIQIKKVKLNSTGKIDSAGNIGDWFLLQPEEIGIEGNVQFLFAEIYDLENKNGRMKNAKPEKEQFVVALQSVISAISELDQESKVYLPLIGAGAGDVGKRYDIMQFTKAILMFNKGQLRQEVHVVIEEKYKEDTPIYCLD